MALVFLSHSSKDKPFVRELHRRLVRDGVTCFFDEESIEWGDNFVTTLEQGIDECEFFVAILSPDFVRSKWVELERTSTMADDPASVERKMLPLMLQPCVLPRFLKPRQSIDVSTTALFELHYPKICKGLGGTPRPDTAPPTDRTTLPPVTGLPALHRMPHRSLGDKFIGRVQPLWTVFDQLSQGKTSIVQGVGVVYGAGGLGKTQLAVEYVHRFNHHYPGGVFWVEADQGIPRLIQILSTNAKVEVDEKLPERDRVEMVWGALGQRQPILVVLDNFPEQLPLRPWLPPTGTIHVLVTTRRRDLTQHPQVSLPYLSPEEGLALLNSGVRQFDAEAKELVNDVGGLPLALELLQSYLNLRGDLTIANVRQQLAETGHMGALEEFASEYKDELPTGHERNVAATFQVSWNLASADGKELLGVMAHLAPTPVPLRLLLVSLQWQGSGAANRLSKAIADLHRLSLVDRNERNEPVAHRLILAFVGHLPESAATGGQTAEAVEKEMRRSSDPHDTASFQELEAVLPHAESTAAREDVAVASKIGIADCMRRHHGTLGRYWLAESWGRDALRYCEAIYPEGHAEIATNQSNLAIALRELGELAEARDLLRKALAAAEASFAPGHPTIAIRQSNLAILLQDLGELAGARDLLRKALAADEACFAPGHPTIARSQSNLAMVLRELGELAEARDLLRKALAAHEASFAPGHPTIAISQSNLATVLKDLGELALARDLLCKALAANEASFAPGHPTIAIGQSNLATGTEGSGGVG